jgi:hypothetical protein
MPADETNAAADAAILQSANEEETKNAQDVNKKATPKLTRRNNNRRTLTLQLPKALLR